MVLFTKKFGTLDPHLPIVWDKVPKKTFFLAPSLTCSACIACTKCPSYLTCISCISCKPALLTLLVSLAKLVLHAFLESLVLFVLLWQFVPLSLLDSWMIWKSMGFWVTEKKLISVSRAKLWIQEMLAHLKMCKNDWKSRQWSQK